MSYVQRETKRLANRIIKVNDDPEAEEVLCAVYNVNLSTLSEFFNLVTQARSGATLGEIMEYTEEEWNKIYENFTDDQRAVADEIVSKMS